MYCFANLSTSFDLILLGLRASLRKSSALIFKFHDDVNGRVEVVTPRFLRGAFAESCAEQPRDCVGGLDPATLISIPLDEKVTFCSVLEALLWHNGAADLRVCLVLDNIAR